MILRIKLGVLPPILWLGLIAGATAQETARIPGYEPSQDPRDFTGVWRNQPLPENKRFQIANEVELTDEAAAKAKSRVELLHGLNGTSIATPHLTCRPEGPNALLNPLAPTYIVQNSQKLVFIVTDEARDVRHVYLNQQHPKRLVPSYGGHSIGHWEGNTLVVDTIGYNGRNALGEAHRSNDFFLQGVVHSDQMHIVQRFTKSADGKSLTIETTLDDPKVMKRPATTTRKRAWVYGKQPLEYNCEQNPSRDNYADMLFDEEYLRPVCIQEEGKGEEPSKVVCDSRRKWTKPILSGAAP